MDYFDVNLDLTEEDLALKAAAHQFAKEVIRPTAKALDDLTPEEVIADVSALDLGMSIHVRDLPLPEGVELRSDPDLSVVSVVAPKAIEEEAPAEAEVAEGAEAEPVAEEGATPAEGSEKSEKKSDD